MGRICLQLLPKPDQEIVYGAGRRQVLGIVSPDLFEQILASGEFEVLEQIGDLYLLKRRT